MPYVGVVELHVQISLPNVHIDIFLSMPMLYKPSNSIKYISKIPVVEPYDFLCSSVVCYLFIRDTSRISKYELKISLLTLIIKVNVGERQTPNKFSDCQNHRVFVLCGSCFTGLIRVFARAL